jgi:cyclohexyl-isocyanide hydratase
MDGAYKEPSMSIQDQSKPLVIGMVLFANLTQLDLTGPYEVLSQMPNTQVYLVAKTLEPVRSDRGLTIVPDMTFDTVPPLDVLFVPGGPGVNQAMEDETVLSFLRKQGENATYITAVCTGALVLAAAGLLQGYRATTHWMSLDLLAMLGVEVVTERVVIDRNRLTSGGVTGGIDFSLVLAAELYGEAVARSIQLNIEYNPEPPYNSGSPKTADPTLVERVTAASHERQTARREIVQRVAGRLGISV